MRKQPLYMVKSNQSKIPKVKIQTSQEVRKQVKRVVDEMMPRIKAEATEDAINILASLVTHTLQAEFEFGEKRLDRFWARFMNMIECIEGDYLTWDDLKVYYSEEYKYKIPEIVMIRDRAKERSK